METNAENTKQIINSANGIQREIKLKGQKLGTVTGLASNTSANMFQIKA